MIKNKYLALLIFLLTLLLLKSGTQIYKLISKGIVVKYQRNSGPDFEILKKNKWNDSITFSEFYVSNDETDSKYGPKYSSESYVVIIEVIEKNYVGLDGGIYPLVTIKDKISLFLLRVLIISTSIMFFLIIALVLYFYKK